MITGNRQKIRVQFFSKGLATLLLLVFVAGTSPVQVFAALYQPGETSNPSCLPTDVNCGVDPAVFGSGLSIGTTTPASTTNALYNSGGTLFWNGVPLSGTTVISSLNGLASSSQSFSVGTSGADFNIFSATSTHTFNIPNSSASSRGLLTSADWIAFNNKLASVLATANIFVGNASGTASAVPLSGDATLSSDGALTLASSVPKSITNDTNITGSIASNTLTLGWIGTLGVGRGGTGTSTVPGNDALLIGDGAGYQFATLANCDSTNQKLIYSASTKSFICSADAGAGGGITSLNGLTVAGQTLATGSTGADFNITSLGSAHTFNLPSASSTARGLLTSGDWTIFNNKISAALASGNIFVGNASSTAASVALSGDATLSNAGVLTIGSGVVTLAKLAADSVNSAKIVDGSISLADLSGDSVDSTKIVDGSIGNADVAATAAIAYSKLALGNSIILSDLTPDSVNSSKIVDGSIVAADLATDAVTSAKILDGTITDTDVAASAAIALSKLASGTSGQIIVANVSGVPVYVVLSGDATIDNAGAITIANSAITNAKLATDAVTSAKILDGAVALADLAANSVDSSKIVDGSLANTDLANSTVGLSLGISGTDANVSGTPASLGGSLTLNLPSASGTVRGLLTSADWTTFNNKENAVTASTTATYYRGDKTFQTLDTSVVPENGNVYYTSARFTTDLNTKTTSNLSEGLNLYYTDARARSALSATGPLTYNSGTGALGITQASSSASGYLSSVDWNTFNNKLTSTLSDGTIFIGNGLNVATGVALSGDATLTNAGVITIAGDAVTSAKILDGAITNADINGSAAIALSKLASGTSIMTSLGTPTGSNANGGSIASNVLTLSLADGTNPGLISTGTQTIAGAKTFTTRPIASVSSNSEGLRITDGTDNVGIYTVNGNPNGSVSGTRGSIALDYSSGTVYVNNDDATGWSALGAAGAGLQSLNGLTAGTQTFATGTSGTDFGISSSGSTHTFNLPTASSTVRGLLSSTDWSTFNNKLTSTLSSGQIFVGNISNVATGVAMSGDATLDNAGVLTIGANTVALGADTTGNYVAGNTAGTGISVSGSAGEGWSPTIGIDQAAGLSWTGAHVFANSAGVNLNPYGTSAGNTTALLFKELAANGANYTGFKAPDNLAANTLYILPTADGTNGQVLATNGSAGLSWVNAGVSSQWTTSGSNIYYSTGNVIVGHTATINASGYTPKTQVTGGATALGVYAFAGDTTGGRLILGKSKNGTVGTLTMPISGDTLGVLSFSGAGSTQFEQGAAIIADTTEAWSGTARGSKLFFQTTANGATVNSDRMVIDQNGNVGIGDMTPDHLLDINGNVGLTGGNYLNWGDTSGTNGYGLRDSSGTIQFKNSGGSWAGIPTTGSQWTTVGSNIYYNTGSVGIGTTNPTEGFQTNNKTQTARFDSSYGFASTNNVAYWGLQDDSNDVNITKGFVWKIDKPANTGSPANLTLRLVQGFSNSCSGYPFCSLSSINGTGIDAVTFAGNGYVGIGTSAPGAKLEVDAFHNSSGIELRNASLGSRASWVFYPVTSGNNTDMRLWEYRPDGSTGDRMTFQSNGNVGIGTTNPGNKLEVVGQVKMGTGNAQLFAHGLSTITTTGGSAVCANATDVGLCTSLSQYKTNITDITNALELIKGLRPVNYDWKDGYYNGIREDIGFLAEDVQALDPRLAEYNTDGSLVGVRYDHMIALVAKGVQEQQQQIAGLTGMSSLVFASTTDDILSATDTNLVSDVIAYIIDKINSGIKIVHELVAERVVAVVGWFNKISAKEICARDDSGAETCITKSELDQLLNKMSTSANTSSSSNPTSLSQPAPSETPAQSNTPASTESNAATTPISDTPDPTTLSVTSQTGDQSTTTESTSESATETPVPITEPALTPSGDPEPASSETPPPAAETVPLPDASPAVPTGSE